MSIDEVFERRRQLTSRRATILAEKPDAELERAIHEADNRATAARKALEAEQSALSDLLSQKASREAAKASELSTIESELSASADHRIADLDGKIARATQAARLNNPFATSGELDVAFVGLRSIRDELIALKMEPLTAEQLDGKLGTLAAKVASLGFRLV